MGTVRNRKQDREEPQVTNNNNLNRLGTILISETKDNLPNYALLLLQNHKKYDNIMQVTANATYKGGFL